jgi:hypothetical protein
MLLGKLEEKNPFKRSNCKHRNLDNIPMGLREEGCELD